MVLNDILGWILLQWHRHDQLSLDVENNPGWSIRSILDSFVIMNELIQLF